MFRTPVALSLFAALTLTACSSPAEPMPPAAPTDAGEGLQRATFAGGCFWCMEAPFDKLPGVVRTTSGYTDGKVHQPTYKQVGYGDTGHTEALEVVFDPKKITYARLLEVFWHNIDPTVVDRQFCDVGNQYRTGIYVHDEAQRKAAEASRKALVESGRLPGPVVTPVKAAAAFYPAEDYHQDFYKKNPSHYYRYREGCGRDARLKALWGDHAGH